jgi:predicted nucleotidyltransferase component of viral defense system
MIKPAEIQQKARENGVRDQQIEKDYVLSWILRGIAQHEQLSKVIIFKGGTVLKKAYFEDYRISEDLDFTLIDNAITNKQIFKWFKEAFEFVKEEANIPLEILDNNEHNDGGINFYIGYVGPLGGHGSNKKVKIDISRIETLEFKPVSKPAHLEYSDLEDHQLLCYSLEELLIEKMRSVMERMQARDFYDLWYLLEVHGMTIDLFLDKFRKKCISKGLNPSDFHKKLEERLPQYKGRWESSLSEQIKDLPLFENVERETLRNLRKLKI